MTAAIGTARPRAIVIHGLAQARAAAATARALGVAVRLRSARGAAAHAGPMWFRELVEIVRAEYPDVRIEASLDCADQAGLALGALRLGIETIRFDGPPRVRARIAAIAAALGAKMDDDGRRALDLAGVPDDRLEAACRDWLG